MARYPLFRQIKSNAQAMIAGSAFAGGYQGLAANYWWGGGTGTGTGLMVPVDNSETNATLLGFRQNVMKDNSTFFWYYQNTGNESQNQQIIDEWIDMWAYAGVKVINPLYYMRIQDMVSYNGVPFPEKIWYWFDYYLASPNKHKVKFAVGIISRYASFDANSATFFPVAVGTWLNLPTFAAYWASLMADPQYVKDRTGKPIVYTFNDTIVWDATHLGQVTSAVTALGIPAPTYVNLNLQTTNVNQITAYGPSGAALSGTQNSFKAQWQKDVSIDATAGSFPRQQGITLVNDGRPVRGSGTWYADLPVYTEAEAHWLRRLQYARSIRNGLNPDNAIYNYAFLEAAEGGMEMPDRHNVTRGVNTPSRGPILDALANVTMDYYPPAYTDYHHAADLFSGVNAATDNITRTGVWSTVANINNGGGGANAPYMFKVNRTSAAGATWTLTRSNCVGFNLRGTLGPTLGTYNVQVDGGAPTLVVQTAVGVSYNQSQFDSGDLAVGTHTLTVTQVSGTIDIDECEARIERTLLP